MNSRNENSPNNILKYDAFISYRHCEFDQNVAVTLHKKLENYKLPKSVLSKVKGDKTKITRVFRDEDELSLPDNLSEPIEQALFNSEFLIVICTPRLPKSEWCIKEIETFLKNHDRKHILLVLAEGEPDESFPEILKYEDIELTDEKGNIHTVRRDMEPLAADVRGDDKKAVNRAMDVAVIKLASAMFGLNFDDLRQRQREQRLKKMFAVWSAITVSVLIFAIVCLGLLTVIVKQHNDIKEKYAGTVADASKDLLEAGRRKDAIYVLRSVLDNKETYNSDAYRQMTKALDLYALGEEYIPLNYYSIPSIINDYKLSGDNNYIVVGGLNRDYYIIDAKKNEIMYSFETSIEGMISPNYGFDGEEGIIYSGADGVIYADFNDNSEEIIYEANATIISDANCDITSILMNDKFVGYMNGQTVYETDLDSYSFGSGKWDCIWYTYSPDGNHVLLSIEDQNDSWLLQFNTVTGRIELNYPMESNLISSYATDGRRVYIALNNYMYNRMPVDSTLSIIDTYDPKDVKNVNIPLSYTKNILFCDAGICITAENSAIMLDENDFRIIYKTEGISNIVSAFTYKTGIGIVDADGSFYIFDDDLFSYGKDMTADLFGIIPRSTVNQVIYQNDKFYYYFADDYIVEYVDNPDAVKQTEDFRDFGYYNDLTNLSDAQEALDNINDIDTAYVYSSVYSNDKKHIAVTMCDKTLRIYNGDTYELEKVEYGLDSAILTSFAYIKEADIYVLNTAIYSYILDSDFNYISDIEYCVGFEDGSFIVYYKDKYYKLKMLSFEEILQLADTELEGYVPDEAIMNKYLEKN